MDFDFLDKQLLTSSRVAIESFKAAIEGIRPSDKELKKLCSTIQSYPHTTRLEEDFTISAVDGSGEFPVIQQDDIFVHFVTAAGATYRTAWARQHKLKSLDAKTPIFKDFILLSDDDKLLRQSYQTFLESMLGLTLKDLVKDSDYCDVFSQFENTISPQQVTWKNLPFSKSSQIATHAYLMRSIAELGMAIRMLAHNPRYLLLDTSLVYFLLGETPYLPEIMKRYLITQANQQSTAIVALCKSHNIPNGDLIGRYAKDELGLKDHWYLRLPSASLGEKTPAFLDGKEIPPKLSVSYLFKFEATSFPMRIDVDAQWWTAHIGHDRHKEQQFFSNLDFTCHEVRSYGYPYPMHSAHRSASLTKHERKALRDILVQQAQQEGLIRPGFSADPEQLHMSGM